MQIVLTVGLGCERLIYTALIIVNLRNKHEDNAWDAPLLPRTSLASTLQTNVDRYSFQTVPIV